MADKSGEAKELGRLVIGFDEQTWINKRFDIMKAGNMHKFNQHPEYADYLIQTGDRILVESSPVDKIWGIGLSQDDEYAGDPYNWLGLNLLGFALMEVGDFLKEHGHFDSLKNIAIPPWKARPGIGKLDMFWEMGKGEGSVIKFIQYYSNLSEKDKIVFELTNPLPYEWDGFYE